MAYELRPIEIVAGCSPTTENTAQSTPHYLFADKIRFVNGVPQKIGGWDKLDLIGNPELHGVPRNLYSYTLNGQSYYLIGTHTNLYSVIGQTPYNATPASTILETYNNVLATNYATLGSNPMEATSGSNTIVVTDTGHKFKAGDVLTFSLATTFAGLSSGDLNGSKSISNVTTNTYSFFSPTAATSTASGGGTSVVRTSRIVSVTQANTYREGDNIVVENVDSSVGGIANTDIEGIRVVRNVSTGGYDIVADGVATSSATTAGGQYRIYSEMADGNANVTSGSGYGMGQYGVGLYGVAKESSNPLQPSIWSFDRFGDLVVMTRGNGTGLYSWNSTKSTLPALVTNAPTAINYTFVSDNICVTLGAGGVGNRIKWSDQSNLATWTATAENQAGEDDIEGAGDFISHVSLGSANLIFTRNSTYTFRYIRKPFVWETKLADPAVGIIGPNARVSVGGVAYWMGRDNFFMYGGGGVSTIPSNSGLESTLKDYVFDNIDATNSYKSFAWHNRKFNEIWFHYPTNGQSECNAVARYNLLERTWVMDTMQRNAGEYPSVLGATPYLVDMQASIYLHERGYDADGVAMPWHIITPFFFTGVKDTIYLGGIYPDSTLSNGTMGVTINTKRYPNQDAGTNTYTMQPTHSNLIFRKSARYWQYALTGTALGQFWQGGAWQQLVKGGSKR
jgi:hypothetical protein